jgi:hypothetical protein
MNRRTGKIFYGAGALTREIFCLVAGWAVLLFARPASKISGIQLLIFFAWFWWQMFHVVRALFGIWRGRPSTTQG